MRCRADKVGRGQVKRSGRYCPDFLSCSIRSEVLVPPWWDLGSLQRWDLSDPCRLLPDRSRLWHVNRSVWTSPCVQAASWLSADTLTGVWPMEVALRVSWFQEAPMSSPGKTLTSSYLILSAFMLGFGVPSWPPGWCVWVLVCSVVSCHPEPLTSITSRPQMQVEQGAGSMTKSLRWQPCSGCPPFLYECLPNYEKCCGVPACPKPAPLSFLAQEPLADMASGLLRSGA